MHRQVLHQIMVANLSDNTQSWLLRSDGSYVRITPEAGEAAFDAHQYFMQTDSLSGRGSAIELNEPPPLAPKQNGDG